MRYHVLLERLRHLRGGIPMSPAARTVSLLATSVVIVGRASFLRTTVIHTTNSLIW